MLCSVVKSTCRFIQDKNLGTTIKGSCQRETLTLPPRQLDAIFSNHGVKAIGHLSHNIIKLSRLQRSPNILIVDRIIVQSKRHIVANTSIKKTNILRHQGAIGLPSRQVLRTHRNAVQHELTR